MVTKKVRFRKKKKIFFTHKISVCFHCSANEIWDPVYMPIHYIIHIHINIHIIIHIYTLSHSLGLEYRCRREYDYTTNSGVPSYVRF